MRLQAVAGPLTGEVFEVAAYPFSIGRVSANALSIPESSVSRSHCELVEDDDALRVRDLGSRHGTRVNGLRVDEARLSNGDLLDVCGNSFRVLMGAAAVAETGSLFSEAGASLGTTVQLDAKEGLYRRPERMLGEESSPRALSALLRLGLEAEEVRDLGRLAERVLPLALEIVAAERAVMLVPSRSDDEWTAHYGFATDGESIEGELSRTVVDRVVSERRALLAGQLTEHEELGRAESLREGEIRTLLAVPVLGHEDEVLGLLYLDSEDPNRRFDRQDLLALTALAGLLAPLILGLNRLERLESERLRLHEAALQHEMVGESEAMRRVFELLGRVAASDSTVLIQGESGTGKELAARAIHRSSARSDRPFVAINCAALSETLIESELFGHERGAFTGADRRRAGKIEAAEGGTLFLDEIAELPLALQAKLLRFLEERELQRVGGTRTLKADVRVVAATNRVLSQSVERGEMREDLYYRLSVVPITLPPLRERGEDVSHLAEHFVTRHSARLNRSPPKLSAKARGLLMSYRWPGNVRELNNVLERAVVLGEGGTLEAEDLPEELREGDSAEALGRYQDVLRETKRKLILSAMREAGGRYTEAARILGLNSNYLHRLVRNLGLRGEIAAQVGPAERR